MTLSGANYNTVMSSLVEFNKNNYQILPFERGCVHDVCAADAVPGLSVHLSVHPHHRKVDNLLGRPVRFLGRRVSR